MTLPSPLWLVERVLFRDGLIVIIDKPAGVPVHAGPGGGPNLEAGFDALRFGLPRPPALAHRLDRDTSSCLVLGRHPKALRRLGRRWAAGRGGTLRWRGRLAHVLTWRRGAVLRTRMVHRSYPCGYAIEKLGPRGEEDQ